LDRGADVNTRNDFGETPLMNAASLGYFKMCELLLKRGADLEVRATSEETAISKAAQSGERSVLMMLLDLLPAGADINAYFDDIIADITLKDGGEIAKLLAARGLKGFSERYESSGPA
jgi:ankyrin repeat protein